MTEPRHLTPEERAARGKAARREVPRSSHADWEPPPARRDPVDILREQEVDRVPELIPHRHSRMLESPFAFYRGAAAVMAADLAGTPRSGIRVQLCGDAHLANFGGFASPERNLLFDLNDFDETLPGPWEWDVKRLAASIEIAGRAREFKPAARRASVQAAVRAYREAMRRFATMGNLAVWYEQLDAAAILAAAGQRVRSADRRRFDERIAKAHRRDSVRAQAKLTTTVGGERRIASDPPLIVPIEELLERGEAADLEQEMRGLLARYKRSLRSDRRALLDTHRYVHMARKVVGVGSVGTRCWVILFAGRDDEDPLFLQVKEAGPSVLEPYAGAAAQRNHGQRVVEGQWLMQASGDILLGWLRADQAQGHPRDFYVRQLWDWKVSAEIETMRPSVLMVYGQMCGWTLARAHVRSGDRIAIAAYLGAGESFDRALAAFASDYADQNERDHRALADAAAAGTMVAANGYGDGTAPAAGARAAAAASG